MSHNPYWKEKSLSELSPEEWEMLCDGCGLCCLKKIVDGDTEEIHYTAIACRLLDTETCRCRDYEHRKESVSDCAILSPRSEETFLLLPETCAYRLLWEKKDLPDWHPLVCKNFSTIHDKNVSVRGKAISEEYIHPDDWEEFIH